MNNSGGASLFQMFDINVATTAEVKEYEKLKAHIMKQCVLKCSRRERSYQLDGEICPAKCFDKLYQFYQLGLAKINNYEQTNYPKQNFL